MIKSMALKAQTQKGEQLIKPGRLEYINHSSRAARHGEAIGVTYVRVSLV